MGERRATLLHKRCDRITSNSGLAALVAEGEERTFGEPAHGGNFDPALRKYLWRRGAKCGLRGRGAGSGIIAPGTSLPLLVMVG